MQKGVEPAVEVKVTTIGRVLCNTGHNYHSYSQIIVLVDCVNSGLSLGFQSLGDSTATDPPTAWAQSVSYVPYAFGNNASEPAG
jgi:hypothetical protein